MNARISLAFFAAALAVTLPSTTARAVNPPDKNLETVLRAIVQEPQKELTDEHYARVYVLDAVGKGIKDLTGLEKCKNLASARLSKNQIADVKPLAGLANLQSLDLADNKIADVKPLAELKGLQYLELSKNAVTDVKPLAGLTRLNALYLSENKIADIGPLAGLDRLWSLYLAKNQLKDIAALGKLTRISTLDLSDNQIENVAALANLTEMNLVMIERNKIADWKPLIAAAEKDAAGPMRFAPFLRLYLEGNPIPAEQRAALQKTGVRLLKVETK
jgi:hypothetical protein